MNSFKCKSVVLKRPWLHLTPLQKLATSIYLLPIPVVPNWTRFQWVAWLTGKKKVQKNDYALILKGSECMLFALLNSRWRRYPVMLMDSRHFTDRRKATVCFHMRVTMAKRSVKENFSSLPSHSFVCFCLSLNLNFVSNDTLWYFISCFIKEIWDVKNFPGSQLVYDKWWWVLKPDQLGPLAYTNFIQFRVLNEME